MNNEEAFSDENEPNSNNDRNEENEKISTKMEMKIARTNIGCQVPK